MDTQVGKKAAEYQREKDNDHTAFVGRLGHNEQAE
jgi:hypothetical protein